MSDAKRIHLIGVCGTAMATLAALLKSRGHIVQGSDQNVYPPMSDFLVEQGIRTFSGYAADHITRDIDLVVVGNAISRGNAELESMCWSGRSVTARFRRPFATTFSGARARSLLPARTARPRRPR